MFPDEMHDTREALLDFYDGEALHAAPMYHRREFESLRRAIRLSAGQHDGMDVVVVAPVAADDEFGAAARAKCLRFLAPHLQRTQGVELFVLDQLDTPTAAKRDQHTFSDLRSEGQLVRDTALIHVQPSEEALLGLPDVLAWSYRQKQTRGDSEWFDPLSADTEVHEL
ncbi:MAG: hypothetical protein ACQEWM_06045 [Actinomycetota bacterium]